MQVLQGKQDVRSVKLGGVLLESTDLAQVEEELTTWAVLKAEVELALGLERVVHLDDELVIDALLFTPYEGAMPQLEC